MEKINNNSLEKMIIKQSCWLEIIPQFIDVLKVNIFIVNREGKLILSPVKDKHGGQLLTNKDLKYDFMCESPDYIERFEESGKYLEAVSSYRLHMYAMPLQVPYEVEPNGYLVIGPVVINKKLDSAQYRNRAEINHADPDLLINELHEIRVVSNIMIRSILDLVSATIHRNISSDVEEKISLPINTREENILNSFLDTALTLTDTECGSIMILDEQKNDLSIQFLRGSDEKNLRNVRVSLGEGIAGIAAQDNSAFVIGGESPDNRISHLLKRPEIKQALVMPLLIKDRVFGVLNLHTKRQDNRNHFNLGTLRSLSALLSAAL